MSFLCPRALQIPRAATRLSLHHGTRPSSTSRCLRLQPQCFRLPHERHLTATSYRRSPLNNSSQKRATPLSRRRGPFSASAFLLFLISGAGLWVYFREEKKRLERQRIAEASKGVGRPKVGGPFDLKDHNGEAFTEAEMKGGFSIVYFGFTHCPDICPEELDKLSKVLELVDGAGKSKVGTSAFLPLLSSSSGGQGQRGGGGGGERAPLLPLFVTCDPARDTPAVLKAYLAEFHPGIVGLTGTWEQIRDVCKKYRVYFSTPEGVKPGEDYLVDHSIYFYVMDPEGAFVEAIGRQHSPERAAQIILEHMSDWDGGRKKG